MKETQEALDFRTEKNASIQRRTESSFLPAALRMIPSFYLDFCSEDPSSARNSVIDRILQKRLRYNKASVGSLLYVKD